MTRWNLHRRATCGLMLALLLSGCGGGGGGGGSSAASALVVDAGPDAGVMESALVTLSATLPSGGSATAWQWIQTSGPMVALAGDTTPMCTFTAPEAPVDLTVGLQFTCNATVDGTAVSDTVAITVQSVEHVVFVRSTDLDAAAIWRTNVQTGVINRVSHVPTTGRPISQYVVSPTGTHVAYTIDANVMGRYELYIARADGTAAVHVTTGLPAYADANIIGWSPDGTRFAFLADLTFDGGEELFTVLADGTGTASCHPPFMSGDDVTRATWAPDGSRLAFRALLGGATVSGLFSCLPGGTGLVELSKAAPGGSPGGVGSFTWSPTSAMIAYIGDFDTAGTSEVYAVAAAGGMSQTMNGALVMNGEVSSSSVRWGPDGSVLTYRADQDTDGETELYASRIAGGSPVKLNGNLPAGSDVGSLYRWAPDGLRIAYYSDERIAGVGELFSVSPTGTSRAQVSTEITSTGSVSQSWEWLPDSTGILYSYSADRTVRAREYWIAGPTGLGQVQITHSTGAADGTVGIELSPRGDRVVWTQSDGIAMTTRVFLVNRDGTGLTPLSPVINQPLRIDNQPDLDWAADGSVLMYATSDGLAVASDDLMVVRADGTGARSIAGTPPGSRTVLGSFADWAP